MNEIAQLDDQTQRMIDIAIALSSELNHARLLERLLLEAKALTNADGGTLYIFDDDRSHLIFEISHNDSLGIAVGGTFDEDADLPPLRLYQLDGSPNMANVAAYVAHTGQVVNIADVYHNDDFDFSGPRYFDQSHDYRTQSMLALPMSTRQGVVIGVLQLINATDKAGQCQPFREDKLPFVTALTSQAAVALDNQQLFDGQQRLLEAFVRVIATAIDAKSAHTSKHCEKVPVLAEMMAHAVHEAEEGPLAVEKYSNEDFTEIRMAAWMHDCGKIATPDHIVEKSTKLETVYDRIEAVLTRFAALEAQVQARHWQTVAELGGTTEEMDRLLAAELAAIKEDAAFLAELNRGAEWVEDDMLARLERIALRHWQTADGTMQPILTADELEVLSVRRGTLTAAERKVINDHIVVTNRMLEALPFPRNLARVPEYAGNHHEKMDGTGYPKGLQGHEMSVPARFMAIADVFEALTSSDRPYKKPMGLRQAMGILSDMRDKGHIDRDLFALFVQSGTFQAYAENHLSPEQMDDPDWGSYL